MSNENEDDEREEALNKIISAKTFVPIVKWDTLREFLVTSIINIVTEQYEKPLTAEIYNPLTKLRETLQQMTSRITSQLQSQFIRSPPFTLLRICELVKNPTKHYAPSSPESFLMALESLVYVESCLDEFDELKFDKSVEESVVQTIEMEPIEWITSEHLKELEEDLKTKEEDGDEEGKLGDKIEEEEEREEKEEEEEEDLVDQDRDQEKDTQAAEESTKEDEPTIYNN